MIGKLCLNSALSRVAVMLMIPEPPFTSLYLPLPPFEQTFGRPVSRKNDLFPIVDKNRKKKINFAT
jgi:hypothetical protein